MPAKLLIPDSQRALRRAWVVARCQARHRGETWDLSWEQWRDLWQGLEVLRGRRATSLTLNRRDCLGPWHIDNVIIESRAEHLARIVPQKKQHRQQQKEKLSAYSIP